MPSYSFENLDATLFEHLAIALGQEHIARGLRPFGAGPDGGREATYEGRMDYPTQIAPWDGYLVVQCKRKETRGATPKDEADWALEQLDAEMEKYSSAKVPRKVPEYFLFITNAELSAKPKEGGKDRFVARLDHWVAVLGMRKADVWDREMLSRLLDRTQAVAERFGLLHAGDLIHHAAQAVLNHRKGVEATLSLFLQEELRADQYVRLAQAGHAGDERTPLARVFVDLRSTRDERGGGTEHLVVQAIQSASDRPVYPTLVGREQEVSGKLTALMQGITAVWLDPSRFVLVGGPGQGKSTLVQHLAQRHRAALLYRYKSTSLNLDTGSTLQTIKDNAEASGIGLPVHPRFPFRIVLEQFADALAKGETTSVLDFIAYLVKKRTGRLFERDDAEQLLQHSPWFVAFDGLDEVPAVSNRADVMDAVRRFIGEARAFDSDLVVVATTRPQGYEDEFSPTYYNHLYLTPLSKDEALNYARRFVETKYVTDADRRERVIKRLESAAEEDATVRLMVSPLQVTIMAALVDLVGNPPRERYPLFDRYYEVVYQREQERGLGSSEVLAEHRADINALHDRVGLLLQIATETAGQTQGRLSGERLRELVRERLISVGFEGVDLDRVTKSLVEVALNRLVFIVPLEEDQYGFEVRSLQEFAAARAIMRRGSPEQIKQRLLAIAPVPYWRNTVLFAVGLVFAEREDLSDTVAQLCREINEDEKDPALFHSRAGSQLALDILEDGVVDRRPSHRRSLLETALLLLNLPDDRAATRLAVLYRPEDEGRYVTAARSVVTHGHAAGVGVFVLLATLVERKVAWAKPLLRDLWPTDTLRARWVFEHVAMILEWDEWQVESALQAARESSPVWVAEYLAEYLTFDWIRDTKVYAKIESQLEIHINGVESTATYLIPNRFPSAKVLAQIAAANPTHASWSPYLHGRAFIMNPVPETLAECLSGLATLPSLDEVVYATVPWPLLVLLRYAESPEMFETFSKWVQTGELGNASDWQDAEERWARNGVTPEDFAASAEDPPKPFTATIGKRGMVSLPMRVTRTDEGLRKAVSALEKGWGMIHSGPSRELVAEDLCFCLNIASEKGLSNLISLSQLAELAQWSRWWINAPVFVDVIHPSQECEGTEGLLEQIGKVIAITGWRPVGKKISKEREDRFSRAAAITSDLLNKNNSSESLVRLLASLAVFGAPLNRLSLDPTAFGPQGQVALVALNLFTEGASGLTSKEVASLAQQLWSFESPVFNEPELPHVVRQLVGQIPVSNYATAVLDILLRSHIMDYELSKAVLVALASAAQHRTSNLDNLVRQVSLGL